MKTNKLRVGFVQCQIKSSDPNDNFSTTLSFIKRLISKKCNLIFLPEMFLGMESSKLWRESYNDALRVLHEYSQKYDVTFFGSGLRISQRKPDYNSAFLIQKKLEIQHYDKIHLFKLEGEQKKFRAGKKSVLFRSKWGKIAPLVCYDIRFPELLRKLTIQGAKFAFVCAQWPSSRNEHWKTLLSARAIENQIYIIACNRIGEKKHLKFSGLSGIVNPWGEWIFQIKGQKHTGYFDLNLNDFNDIRKKYPFLSDIHSKEFHFDI